MLGPKNSNSYVLSLDFGIKLQLSKTDQILNVCDEIFAVETALIGFRFFRFSVKSILQ